MHTLLYTACVVGAGIFAHVGLVLAAVALTAFAVAVIVRARSAS